MNVTSTKQETINYMPFHTKDFWENYYKQTGFDANDWYFPLVGLNSKLLDISSLSKDSEILITGVGTSSILDYLMNNKFVGVTCVDFSESLIKHLKSKYESCKDCSEWDCIELIIYSREHRHFNAYGSCPNRLL